MADVLLVQKLLKKRQKLKITRPLKNFLNPFDMREWQFIQKYRLSKEAARFLIQELVPHLKVAPNALPMELQVLTVLKLLGNGEFQHNASEGFCSSQASVSRYLNNVLVAITNIAKKFINFPTSEVEISNTKHAFHQKLRFPNTIGAIDCTHIEILKPNVDDWFVFLNRKGKFSINVQMICDADLKILDVVARWPGSSHDAMIWNLSGCRNLFSNGVLPSNTLILGDSGYPLEPWLMTPFLDPAGPAEEIFNERHRSARNVIERCFGVLKARFRILSKSGGCLCYSPKKACLIVLAVTVLHNICVKFNVKHPEPVDEEDDDDDEPYSSDNQSAIIIRYELANRFQNAR